ncbi:MAG: hypothetical protein AAF480_05520 [Actinomycetota bacterium]
MADEALDRRAADETVAPQVPLRIPTLGGGGEGEITPEALGVGQAMGQERGLHASASFGWQCRHAPEHRHAVGDGHARAAQRSTVPAVVGDRHVLATGGVGGRGEGVGRSASV